MWALSSLAYEKDYFYQKPNLTPTLMRSTARACGRPTAAG